jgi:hypothetical protein
VLPIFPLMACFSIAIGASPYFFRGKRTGEKA